MVNETPKSSIPLSNTSPDTVPQPRGGSQGNTHMPRGSVPSGCRPPPPSFLAGGARAGGGGGVSPQEEDTKDRVGNTGQKGQNDVKRKVEIPSFDLSGSSSSDEE